MLHLLKHLRVVDVTSVLLGPYATQILGDFGADVVKIEPLAGDIFRPARPGRTDATGAGYLNSNRNKRSIAVNLKHPEGREIVHALVREADVFVHNMRPKTAAALGLAYEDLKALNPALIYAFSAGFGQQGPYADRPAYDDIMQAMTGIAYMNPGADGEPRFLPTVLCDKVSALHLAIAILAAVASRAETGRGMCIEAPMFESVVSFHLMEQLGGLSFEPAIGPSGYPRLTSPYRKLHKTKDGYMCVLPYSTENWMQFFDLIGQPELAREEWVCNPIVRSRSNDRLYQYVSDAAPSRTTEEWLRLFRERDIPCAAVNRVEDLLDDPHLNAVAFFEAYEHPTEGALRAFRSPFVVQGTENAPDSAPESLGASTRAVLEGLGYAAEKIQALIEAKIVGDYTESPKLSS